MLKLPSISEVVPISDGIIPWLVVDLRKYICTNGKVSPVSPSTTVPEIPVFTSCAITIPAMHKKKNMYFIYLMSNLKYQISNLKSAAADFPHESGRIAAMQNQSVFCQLSGLSALAVC